VTKSHFVKGEAASRQFAAKFFPANFSRQSFLSQSVEPVFETLSHHEYQVCNQFHGDHLHLQHLQTAKCWFLGNLCTSGE
jgi:hypothetical protein